MRPLILFLFATLACAGCAKPEETPPIKAPFTGTLEINVVIPKAKLAMPKLSLDVDLEDDLLDRNQTCYTDWNNNTCRLKTSIPLRLEDPPVVSVTNPLTFRDYVDDVQLPIDGSNFEEAYELDNLCITVTMTVTPNNT